MKKVLFFDVDGTLVDHGNHIDKIPNTVKKEIKRLQNKGYALFVASGRPKAFISDTILEAGFDGYILCNGAHVELNGKMISKRPLDKKALKKLVDILEGIKSEYILETAHHCYLKPEYEVLEAFFKTCDVDFNQITRHFNVDDVLEDTLKVEVNTKDENSQMIVDYVDGLFDYDSHGTDNAFEIYSKSVSKATGIQEVLDYLQISKENSYAFGDGLNDIEMLQMVGHGVAMGNACQELKDVADEITDSILEDGLAKYLKTIE